MISGPLNKAKLRPHLERCGYQRSLMDANVPLQSSGRSALAAFAYSPRDSRSACIAAIDGFTDPHQDAVACRALGTPVIFVCLPAELQWWVTGTSGTAVRETVPVEQVDDFFAQHQTTFAPDTIYRAKTIGRFDPDQQREFVDVGLMPLIEAEAGRKLVNLLVGVVKQSKRRLRWSRISQANGNWLLKANFWLLAAKILKDKDVGTFSDLNLTDVDTVYERLAEHYGTASDRVPIDTELKREALCESAEEIARFTHLGLVSTESLAHVYEAALITKETRAELGTHSTPAYLVDYIIGRLRPWIEETHWKQQRVFEPACGHAAFMLAALRVLGELLPANMTAPSGRHRYLRQRLEGCDYDPFALEIARLSLTLGDVPNPNGWNLKEADMFGPGVIETAAQQASLILANPPFEKFSDRERRGLAEQGAEPRFHNKAAEMLWRVASSMQPGAILGVVLPQGVLHSKNAVPVRRFLAEQFEISEICLFPDKVFKFSDAETAVILARRISPPQSPPNSTVYRRIRESDVEHFKKTFVPTRDDQVHQAELLANGNLSFLVAELADLWDFCSKHPRLDSVADVGQGLIYRSLEDPDYPAGKVTLSDSKRKGFVIGFARFRKSLETHALPDPVWFNLDPRLIRRPLLGTTTGVPQVLLNYSPVSRGPWRLKVFFDRQGHPVTSCFLVVRPIEKRCPLEALWAICNSPFANAFSYAFSGKRHNLAGMLRNMPIPRLDGVDWQPLVKAVRTYFNAVASTSEENSDPTEREELRTLHWRIDAEVLSLYELPTELEHQVLMLFSGETRGGVPFVQNEYLPTGHADPLSLRDLLATTCDWDQTNDRRAKLILDEERKGLGKRRKAELEHLQYLTDARIRLVAPLPLAELDKMAADLKRSGLWVEEQM